MTPAVEDATDAAGFGDGVVGPDVNTTGFGGLKLVRLSTLKNSPRNCRLRRSDSENLFAIDRSSVASPGPCSTSRPTLPYVPASGTMNAFGLKYWFGPPSITLPLKRGFRDGRTELRVLPSLEGL